MTNDTPARQNKSLAEWLRAMPRWKKIAVAVAIGTMVVGGVLQLTSGAAATPANPPSGSSSGVATSLLEGYPKPNAGPVEAPASQGIFRLGFSFLVGFCIGSFLRAALRLVAIAVGFWLLMTFLLNYMGLVVVDWQAMDSLWNRFASNVQQEWGSFQTFMTGSLPTAGLAATGLMVGLKRN